MRLIRARAAAWRIDPARLGLIGFSAGGHLGAMLAVGHADPVHAAIDAADAQSARPAYAGLAYPVVNFAAAGLASGSAAMLLGDTIDPAVLTRHTPVARVTADTPPVCLVHAMDDPVVPIRQSLAMIAACTEARVPVEAHLFEAGGHGFGALHLAADMPGRMWPELFARWTARH
ncbi:MAG: prolyl oligopeptidase family serine peptidase [Sphingomonas sp.]